MREVPQDWKKADITSVFKKVKEDDPEKSISPQSLGRLWSKMSSKPFLKHMKDKKVTGSSQHGFSKGRLISLLSVLS